MSKLIVIIQCEQVQKRCSGYNCAHAFYKREGKFADYGADARYLSFTCGGCSGAGLSVKLENLRKRIARFKDEGEVIVHLSSCMVSDNYHKAPCPHLAYIENLLAKKGFRPVVKGTYISKSAERKRGLGIYKEF